MAWLQPGRRQWNAVGRLEYSNKTSKANGSRSIVSKVGTRFVKCREAETRREAPSHGRSVSPLPPFASLYSGLSGTMGWALIFEDTNCFSRLFHFERHTETTNSGCGPGCQKRVHILPTGLRLAPVDSTIDVKIDMLVECEHQISACLGSCLVDCGWHRPQLSFNT